MEQDPRKPSDDEWEKRRKSIRQLSKEQIKKAKTKKIKKIRRTFLEYVDERCEYTPYMQGRIAQESPMPSSSTQYLHRLSAIVVQNEGIPQALELEYVWHVANQLQGLDFTTEPLSVQRLLKLFAKFAVGNRMRDLAKVWNAFHHRPKPRS